MREKEALQDNSPSALSTQRVHFNLNFVKLMLCNGLTSKQRKNIMKS